MKGGCGDQFDPLLDQSAWILAGELGHVNPLPAKLHLATAAEMLVLPRASATETIKCQEVGSNTRGFLDQAGREATVRKILRTERKFILTLVKIDINAVGLEPSNRPVFPHHGSSRIFDGPTSPGLSLNFTQLNDSGHKCICGKLCCAGVHSLWSRVGAC